MELDGRVAMVSGAGSGIGEAAARRLAKEGVRVAALGRTEDELRETVEAIQRDGGQAMTVVADIAEDGQMQAAVDRITAAWDRLDIVFANAGINGRWASLEELEAKDWDQTLNINVKGTFFTVKYAIPWLKKRGGSIIITSSVNGTRMFSNTGATIYACSKAAQVAFTKMIALELAKHKIRVNAICPGAIDTEIDDNTQQDDLAKIREPVVFPKGQIPLTRGKPGTSEQVAELVLFLASDRSSHITGTEMWIDGAQSLLQG